jgi:hypothetical protein
MLSSCGGNGPISSGPGWRGDRFAEEVASRPEQFIGRRLNLTGTVKQVYGTDAFSLGPAGEILVLSPYEQPILPQPPAGARVIVSGELRGVTGDSLEPALRQKLDAATTSGGGDEGTERKAVLVARGIEVLDK